MAKTDFDLVVYSHLRWDFVYQRPQHIIERLGRTRKVLFIEEPIGYVTLKGKPNIIEVTEHIINLQPRIDHANFINEYIDLSNEFIDRFELKNPVLWFYGPGFEKVGEHVAHSLIVYDCMDELSAFKTGNEGLVRNEKNLLAKADVVFTGGKSLYDAKKAFNPNVYCFPSSVDKAHFDKALEKSTPVAKDLQDIKGLKVGYYGVIDERINLKLLKETAQAMPDVAFIMIGPVVKINEKTLPKAKNIYYTGGKPYAELPNYLKGIDIAMMPFAMNKATKFISPTKTLEYMVALKPIISTPIYDVVRDYAHEVKIIKTTQDFVNAIRYYENEPARDKRQREQLQREVITKTSWDNTVEQMENIISKALANKPSIKSQAVLNSRKV